MKIKRIIFFIFFSVLLGILPTLSAVGVIILPPESPSGTYNFSGCLPPIAEGKQFKKPSTIPVKFQLTDNFGNLVSNMVATLRVCNGNNCTDAVSNGNSNTGSYFRYDFEEQQYIFNLSTKSLSSGMNTLLITLDDGKTYYCTVAIR